MPKSSLRKLDACEKDACALVVSNDCREATQPRDICVNPVSRRTLIGHSWARCGALEQSRQKPTRHSNSLRGRHPVLSQLVTVTSRQFTLFCNVGFSHTILGNPKYTSLQSTLTTNHASLDHPHIVLLSSSLRVLPSIDAP